jgi:hypothetical protein
MPKPRPSNTPKKRNLPRARLNDPATHMKVKLRCGMAVLYAALAERAAYEGNVDAFVYYWDQQAEIGGTITPKCARRLVRHEKRIEMSGVHREMRAGNGGGGYRNRGDHRGGAAPVPRGPLAPTSGNHA